MIKLLILNSAKIETSVGKAIKSLCQHVDQNLNVQIVSMLRFNNNNSFNDEIEKWKNIEKKNIQTLVLPERGLGDFKSLFALFKVIKKYRPNIVETSGYKMNILFFFIRKIFRAKWIVFFHGWTTENFKVKLYNTIDNLVAKHADKVFVVAKSIKENLTASGYKSTQILIINNAIENMVFYSSTEIRDFRKELKIPDNSFIISVIGRLSTEKGQLIFLKALNIVNDKLKNNKQQNRILALIVGDGPDKKKLKEYEERNINDLCVRFCGQRDDIGKFYQVSDLICIPSLSENLPYILLESFQYKTPVLATTVGGIPELIESGENGLLVEPNNIIDLSEAIYKCICNTDILGSIKKELGIQKLPEDFIPEQRAKKLYRAYNEILK